MILELHSPGSSPGIQSFSGGLTYGTGAAVLWELLASSTASRGTAYDGVDVSGTLDFSGTTLMRLSFDAAGSTVDWSDAFWGAGHAWSVYDVTGTTSGFGNLSVQPADWLDGSGGRFNTIRPGSSLAVRQTGPDVELVYAVPEPAAALQLVVVGIAILLCSLGGTRNGPGKADKSRFPAAASSRLRHGWLGPYPTRSRCGFLRREVSRRATFLEGVVT